jgi:hypothetical protein
LIFLVQSPCSKLPASEKNGLLKSFCLPPEHQRRFHNGFIIIMNIDSLIALCMRQNWYTYLQIKLQIISLQYIKSLKTLHLGGIRTDDQWSECSNPKTASGNRVHRFRFPAASRGLRGQILFTKNITKNL